MRTLKFLGSQRKIAWVSILAMIMISAALAGCLHDSDDEDGDPDNGDPQSTETDTDTPEPTDPLEPPEPVLAVQAMIVASPGAGWAVNDTFVFDGSNSTVVGGEIVSWTFDFGDGNETTVEAGDDPVVEHEYDRGGLYLVNLTVEATDGNETVEDLRPTAVAVSEVHYFEDEGEGPLALPIVGPTGDPELIWDEAFMLNAGATEVRATFNISDEATTDSSGWAAFYSVDDGSELDNQTFEQGDFEDGLLDLDLAGSPEKSGEHELAIGLDSGEVKFKGSLKFYYGVEPSDLPDPED